MPLVLLAALALLPQTPSTQVVALDLDGLTAVSERAVWGRVVEVTASRRVDNPKIIETSVTVNVAAEQLRRGGAARTTARFVVAGGVVGRFGQHVAGAPQFVVGEELIVALEPLTGGRYGVAGFNQGVWRVQRTSEGVVAVSDRTGVEFVTGLAGEPVTGGATVAPVTTDRRRADALWSALAASFARSEAAR